tara:strand:- start:27 stop:344 length:318 start_codon:yes stop_codon:yes gene_type:complete
MDGVVHFEIPLENVERGTEFYKKVFGWGVEKAGEMPYWMARTSECDEKNMPKELGKINGGFYEKGEGEASNNPVIVIKVENIEEGLKRVEESGGAKVIDIRDVLE